MRLVVVTAALVLSATLTHSSMAQTPDHTAALQASQRLMAQAQALFGAGDLAGARVVLEQMLASCPNTAPASQPHCRVLALTWISTIWQRERNQVRGEETAREAVAIARAELPPGNPRIGTVLNHLGVTLMRYRQLDEAEATFREALGYARDDPTWPTLRQGALESALAQIVLALGRNEEAIDIARVAVEDLRLAQGPQWRPHLANALLTLGTAYRFQGQFHEAETTLREGLRLADPPTGEMALIRPRIEAQLAVTLAYLRRISEASALTGPAMERLIAQGEGQSALAAEVLTVQAEDLFVAGRHEAGEAVASRALALFEAMDKPTYRTAAVPLGRMIFADSRAGRREAGDARVRRFIAAAQAAVPSIDVALSAAWIADICHDTGRDDLARPLAELALRTVTAIPNAAGGNAHLAALNTMASSLRRSGDGAGGMAMLREGIALAAKRPDGGAENGLRLRLALARALYTQELTVEVEEMFAAALRDAEAIGFGGEITAAANNLGQIRAEQGRYAEAEAYLRRAIAAWNLKRAAADYSRYISNSTLTSVLRRQGRYAEALAQAEKTLSEARAWFGPDSSEAVDALFQLGNAQVAAMRVTEGTETRRRAMERKRTTLGERHYETIIAMSVVADDLMTEGKLAEAEALLASALAGIEADHGLDHIRTADVLSSLATLRLMQGRYRESGAAVERSMAISRRVYGDRHPAIAAGEASLARLYLIIGQEQDAERRARLALAIIRQALGEGHPSVAFYQRELAAILVNRGNWPEAKSLLGAGSAILRAVHGPDSPVLAANLLALARVARLEGDSNLAAPLAGQAARLLDKAGLGEKLAGADAQAELARALLAQGKTAEAVGHARRARAVLQSGGMMETPAAIGMLRTLALIALLDRRPADAAADLDQGLSLARRFFAASPVEMAAMLNDRALASARQRQYAEADRVYLEAFQMLEQSGAGRHFLAVIIMTNRAITLDAMGRRQEASAARARARDVLRDYRFIQKPPERWI